VATLKTVHGRTLACAFGVARNEKPVIAYIVSGFRAPCKFTWGVATHTVNLDIPNLLVEEVVNGKTVPSNWHFKILDNNAAKKGIIRGWDINLGNTSETGLVCWGGNKRPTDFREALTVFFNSSFHPSTAVIPRYDFDRNASNEKFSAKAIATFESYVARCYKKKPQPATSYYQIVNGRIDAVALLSKSDMTRYKLKSKIEVDGLHIFPCVKVGKMKYEIVTPERKVKF
jgi:hypothetical protein